MRLIAHESPVSFFEFVQDRTSYDYCLAHLYDENEEYRTKFLQARDKGRTIILDTSVFELGYAFDEEKYLKIIDELKPTWYILPDVLEDANLTCSHARKWNLMYIPHIKESRPIAVVQGKSYSEIRGCYEYLDKDLDIDKLAISFDYSYYGQTVKHANKYVSWMLGRVQLLGQLLDEGVINKNKPHHLLGVALPAEGKFYGGPTYDWIESVDTSNPIVHGLKGVMYQPGVGLYTKDSEKLFHMINYKSKDEDMEREQKQLLHYNIQQFYEYWNSWTF